MLTKRKKTHKRFKDTHRLKVNEWKNIVHEMKTKPTANIILNNENLKNFPLRLGTRQGSSLLPLPFNIVLEILSQSN